MYSLLYIVVVVVSGGVHHSCLGFKWRAHKVLLPLYMIIIIFSIFSMNMHLLLHSHDKMQLKASEDI